MSEPRLYKTKKEVWLKFLSLLVSFKYQAWIASTIALYFNLIDPLLWIGFTGSLLGIRELGKTIIEKANILKPNEPTDTEPKTE